MCTYKYAYRRIRFNAYICIHIYLFLDILHIYYSPNPPPPPSIDHHPLARKLWRVHHSKHHIKYCYIWIYIYRVYSYVYIYIYIYIYIHTKKSVWQFSYYRSYGKKRKTKEWKKECKEIKDLPLKKKKQTKLN